MNFKNETGYAKRQTYRQPTQPSRQSVTQQEQQKAEQATNQTSGQSKPAQPASTANTPSQEHTESQPTNVESTPQQFPAATVQPPTSKYTSNYNNTLYFTFLYIRKICPQL